MRIYLWQALTFEITKLIIVVMNKNNLIRKSFTVSGQVQGVGFRPFVWRLAFTHNLAGFVRNTSHGVSIEVQGLPDKIADFKASLTEELPPLAKIISITEKDHELLEAADGFNILPSIGLAGQNVLASPDVAPCPDCLREMRDPADPRYNYPFISCTNCGPRFSIIQTLPYDRASTTMSCFSLCPLCSSQYLNPGNRRFHAQPLACPECGPQIWFVEKGEQSKPKFVGTEKALQQAFDFLTTGKILAIKGLGGFQLVCDATNQEAVKELRRRKNRPHKALAIMARDLDTVSEFCFLSPEHSAVLDSPEKPIVLCPFKAGSAILAPQIAPDNADIGVMLPSTPLHALLFDKLKQNIPLVMTSANPPGEPICLGNREALERLDHLADAWLFHDRDIQARVDDSVVGIRPHTEDLPGPIPSQLFLRRARGYVPRPIWLAQSGPAVLGVGGELKTTFCLTRKNEAFVSQHIGDMENLAVMDFYQSSFEHFERLLETRPQAIVCDLHPDFMTSHFARELSQKRSIPAHALQHHAAHAAAVMAEYGMFDPALVLCLDGTGLGGDGSIWGGELVLIDAGSASWQRVGRLSPFLLPGGDEATRHPWRIARALQKQCNHAEDLSIASIELAAIDEMIENNLNCQQTSSCGRLFDAVAAQLGLCSNITYEGQAAIRLETCAQKWLKHNRHRDPWQIGIRTNSGLLEIESGALFLQVCKAMDSGKPAGDVAASFHVSVANAFGTLAVEASRKYNINKIGLAGGVLQNSLMARLLAANLAAHGCGIMLSSEMPAGDGGISLGQAFWGQRLMATGKL